MFRYLQQLESTHADARPNRRLDPLRHLLHDPGILAPDPSPRRVLALPASIAVQNSRTYLDRNVGTHGRDHRSLAQRPFL